MVVGEEAKSCKQKLALTQYRSAVGVWLKHQQHSVGWLVNVPMLLIKLQDIARMLVGYFEGQ